MRTFLAIGVAWCSTVFVVWADLPSIAVSPDGQTFTVTYQGGARWACTVYEEQTASPLLPPYRPRHCGSLEDDSTSYVDDWEFIPAEDRDWIVFAEVGYPRGKDLVYVETNRLSVHH